MKATPTVACSLVITLVALTGCQMPRAPSAEHPPTATFSIVAFDPDTGELGIAVQSRVVAVGAVVPWARAGVGAVATQAWANTRFGPEGLALLADGLAPGEVVEKLLAADPQRDRRQLAIVDARGRTGNHTGKECLPWAGAVTGRHYTVQGNILTGEKVVTEMARAFDAADGDLGERLIAALQAGQEAGGDRRGKQSAALLIVRENGGYGGHNDRYRDLRVDDHAEPIAELLRVYRIHKRVFPPPGK